MELLSPTPPPLLDPLLGSQVGNLRILQKIGRGGFGTVYRAEHMPLGTAVALKVLHFQVAEDQILAARLFREAQAMAQLEHPHIARVTDFGHLPDGRQYLAMEFLTGISLSQALKQGEAFDLQRIEGLFGQLCSCLGYIHRKGIVHRDIKPSNIFLHRAEGVSSGDWIKLLDFGIAALADENTLTQSGVSIGSPRYMSPEQALGRSKETDGRADLYSLAILLQQLLTGSLPFAGGPATVLMLKHINEPPPRLSQSRPDVAWAPALEGFLTRALAKDPDARFPDAEAFFQQLQRALQQQRAVEPDITTSLPTPAQSPSIQTPALSTLDATIDLTHETQASTVESQSLSTQQPSQAAKSLSTQQPSAPPLTAPSSPSLSAPRRFTSSLAAALWGVAVALVLLGALWWMSRSPHKKTPPKGLAPLLPPLLAPAQGLRTPAPLGPVPPSAIPPSAIPPLRPAKRLHPPQPRRRRPRRSHRRRARRQSAKKKRARRGRGRRPHIRRPQTRTPTPALRSPAKRPDPLGIDDPI